ncbi:ATP-dependent DNA helicase RecG, partial [Candidatus Curtissbacteria bacterium]|nr:ATP-dependent DNA helicase RecG [Candidatus Curtissbacteria bacterium]
RAKIARLLCNYLKSQNDFLPEKIKGDQDLINLSQALQKIHFPENYDDVKQARKRLAFDELFLIQLLTTIKKRDWQTKRKAPAMTINKDLILKVVDSLPFKLTEAQKRAAREILIDLKRDIPANRLLEGDVGSGKTVVAAIAAYVSYLNGFDVLVAAPTEILAFQHQKTLEDTLKPYGVQIGIWTGSKKIKGHITCGTHALLTTFNPDRQAGLVIVDEQHRFGVAQRAKLFLDHAQKTTPHLLTMTATPIPRTLALTLYGDLDLSVLDEMPKGRQKIATYVVPNKKRKDAYRFIEKQIGEGRQAFIITPFVEPSETMISVKAATAEFEKLKKIFSSMADTPGVKLGLLHGRLKSKEKERIINDFKANKIQVLVTTPVVEVGIDVPNATVMMIESAERFGLAQLHQLRGRVGRGVHKSYCLLFTESGSPNSFRRLKSMEKVHVGFELAEIDLKMRGPGEIFGLKQSGFVNLKIADLSDQITISKAQVEAKKLLHEDPDLKSYPLLSQKLEEISSAYSQPN